MQAEPYRVPVAALEPGAIPPSEPRDPGVDDYLRLLWRHRAVWILLAAAGAALGLLAAWAQQPVYSSRLSLEILPLNETFLNIDEVSPTPAMSGAASRVDVRTQIKILRSRSLRQAVLERLGVDGFAAPERGLLSGMLPAAAAHSSSVNRRAAAIRRAARTVEVAPEDDSRIIEVTAESTQPAAVADFLNALGEEFAEQNLDARWASAQRTEQWLREQLESLKRNLEASEQRLHDYARSQDRVFSSQAEEELARASIERVQAALTAARSERIQLQSRYELALSRDAESLPEVARDATLGQYATELTALRKRHAELLTVYTAAHTSVRKVASQIEQVEQAIARERENVIERLRSEYEASLRREALLAGEQARALRKAAARSGRSIQYGLLRREAETSRGLYEDVLRKVKQAGVASALSANNIRVVDSAAVPTRPSRPNAPLSGAMGALTGLLAGIALVLFRETTDRTVRQPGQIRNEAGLPELGAIPDVRRLGGLRAEGTPPLPDRLSIPGRPLHAADRPAASIALWDAFRGIRTSLLLPDAGEAFPQIIVVTSPGPEEGKTTVAAHLAMSLAEIVPRVLLVDADARRPRLHELFGLENGAGFGDLLQQRSEGKTPAVEESVQQTQWPGLHVLASSRARWASEAPSTPEALWLLRRLRETYPVVVIDTPPALLVPDARLLGRLADGVVLVARCGRTGRDELAAVKDRLIADRTRLLGGVLNGWDPAAGCYGAYAKNLYTRGAASGRVKNEAP